MTTPAPTAATLAVPGATLYYETRGSGPLLLLIPGGAGDAGMYRTLAAALADRYTVVSYDQRCMSRSRLDGPLADQEVQVWSDDARRLLDHLAPHDEAFVMGCSSGAITALDLLARHPDRVRRAVAHEPPLLELLADPAPHRALFAEVRETARTRGPGPAMARFGEGLAEGGSGDHGHDRSHDPGHDGHRGELPPDLEEMAERMHANAPAFLEHVLCPFSSSAPDVSALRRAADKLVLAVGRDSRGLEPLYGPAARLAELLGAGAPAEFPGGHLAAVEQPHDFAEHLALLLR
ncbi:alpha/beta hydrolase [Streptomyces sp. BR123]|uniref:alpha/beta fold hydrolase n=1 Tax=Streptomyces sp. BR123 TaxID=2749828 RepID=UPI0015C419DB|nr:alpha/beta hydrolase [Streptomyces sp. BR123]NXY97919.1 alpha/beta hydrolase [Streptomyces sp. BR123]